jgi:hypothetical protein
VREQSLQAGLLEGKQATISTGSVIVPVAIYGRPGIEDISIEVTAPFGEEGHSKLDLHVKRGRCLMVRSQAQNIISFECAMFLHMLI